MKTKVAIIKNLNEDKDFINEAGNIIKSGGTVAFPTETVYGLGADALNGEAVKKIFLAKGRPQDNPLIIHVSSKKIEKFVKDVPPVAEKLMDKFWPGPMTIILNKKDIVPDETSAGLSTIGVRMPNSEIALKLIEAAGVPIAAPSANISGRPSPTDVERCIEDLDGKIDYILGGERSDIGVESTIVDCTVNPPMVLRPGGITLEMLRTVDENIVIDEAQDYSMLQFLVLQGLTGCRSYTVVGDVNQRLVKIDEVPAMLRLEELYGKFVKRFDLNKSYRSTQQIMEYASKLLDENAIVPFVRKGKYDVEEVEINDKEDLIDTILETLEEYDDENYENIAVITKDKDELQRIAPELKKFTKIMAFDKADIIYRGGKVIVPSYYAKGLEFDGVIVVNFDDNTDDLVKYIMATRALHQLKIINYKGK